MMNRLMWLLCILQAYYTVQGFLHQYPKLKVAEPDGGDPGTPLFLTPYVESGDVAEGRRLARVPLTDTLRIESYAGFFTVNKRYDSNQFFWYFPPIMPNKDSPVIVWLQGGPGATSLFGLFIENGPLMVYKEKIRLRPCNWAINYHMIYIDNPVGTGFSFTNDSRGYCTDETQVGEQLYSTVTQFLTLFPDLQDKKFFVTGESYGGKYVPALGYAIHKNNPTAKLKINLKGLVIGNGWSDPVNQLVYSKYLYQIGLIDWNQAEEFQYYEKQAIDYINKGQYELAYEVFDKLITADMIKEKSVFYNATGFDFYLNYLFTRDYSNGDFGEYITQTAVRKDIHVGNLPFHDNKEVEKHLKQDIMKSVAPWIAELLDHYYIAVYNGQLDILVAYPLTVNYLRNLNFTGAETYKTAKRHVWTVDGEVFGYMKYAGKLVEILVRNAGHMVPHDRPDSAFYIITWFTRRCK